MSANIYNRGIIGANSVGSSGVIGVGENGITYGPPKATGGTVTLADGFYIHTFTDSGLFTPLVGSLDVEYLVIAGGGAGGGANGGAGGGAGGYLTNVGGAFLNVSAAQTVTVGAGGSGSFNVVGSDGTNSEFGVIDADGGGGGGAGGTANTAGRAGGSGGGGTRGSAGGVATASQGNNGGAGGSTFPEATGGGGGAGAVGQSATATVNGNGGDGLASSITGTSVFRAGGGGGGKTNAAHNNTTGGLGGGGAGHSTTTIGENGDANTGGGGGGGGRIDPTGTVGTGGSGGKGVVIVRYPI